MKLQDKMSADQLWVRSHPYYDTFVATHTSGQHFPVVNAPNLEERTEMTMRSIARRFDWDMEKFRLSKKSSDKGNRRRLLKNLSKFVKNPLGYVMWRWVRTKHRMHFMSAFFWCASALALQRYMIDSQTKDKYDEWKQSVGEPMKKGPFQITGHQRMQLGIGMMPLHQWSLTRADPNLVKLNPTYLQNYRLYFDRQNYQA